MAAIEEAAIEEAAGALPEEVPSLRPMIGGLAAAAAWFAVAALTSAWPDAEEWERTGELASLLAVVGGLGWYIQWAQGWAAYGNMYAALLVMALLCSGLVALLFRIRDHLLAWQKGLLRW